MQSCLPVTSSPAWVGTSPSNRIIYLSIQGCPYSHCLVLKPNVSAFFFYHNGQAYLWTLVAAAAIWTMTALPSTYLQERSIISQRLA